jgi:hypothetical protein
MMVQTTDFGNLGYLTVGERPYSSLSQCEIFQPQLNQGLE